MQQNNVQVLSAVFDAETLHLKVDTLSTILYHIYIVGDSSGSNAKRFTSSTREKFI